MPKVDLKRVLQEMGVKPQPRAPKPAVPNYFVGLDLGQAKDYTALAILERHGEGETAVFHARHLQRYKLGTAYPAIVTDVGQMLQRDPLRERKLTLAIDGTGVGAAVVDMFLSADLHADLCPITITGGDTVTKDGQAYRVPKRDLVGVVQVCLQTSRLKIAAALPEAATLTNELQNFQVKISENAHDSYGSWREGTHDDLVLAVALALWIKKKPGDQPGFFHSCHVWQQFPKTNCCHVWQKFTNRCN